MLGKTTSLEVRTPEGVTFHVPIASPVSRCLSLGIDWFCVLALIILISFILNAASTIFAAIPVIGDTFSDFGAGAMIVLQFVVTTFYGMICEWLLRGQTIGKRLMKLRVIDERGLNLTLKQVIIRNLFRNLDILPSMFYLLGGISCALTKRCQRLGDIAAGTLVVREVKVSQPAISDAVVGGENSFATLPHLEARLRQRTTPEEARIALDAVSRRDQLDSGDRLEVFSQIADYFREIAEFPDEITLGLSDEQYVRNVVDSLFRQATR